MARTRGRPAGRVGRDPRPSCLCLRRSRLWAQAPHTRAHAPRGDGASTSRARPHAGWRRVRSSAACPPYPAVYDHTRVAQSLGATLPSRASGRYCRPCRSSSHRLGSKLSASLGNAPTGDGSMDGCGRKHHTVPMGASTASAHPLERGRKHHSNHQRAHAHEGCPSHAQTPRPAVSPAPGGCGFPHRCRCRPVTDGHAPAAGTRQHCTHETHTHTLHPVSTRKLAPASRQASAQQHPRRRPPPAAAQLRR